MFPIKTILGMLNWKIAAIVIGAVGFLGGAPLISGCGRAGDIAENALEGIGEGAGVGIGEGAGVGTGEGTEFGEGDDRLSTVNNSGASDTTLPNNSRAVAIPSIAVIDVNIVAQRIGAMKQINAMLDVEEQKSNQRLSSMQTQFMQDYNLAAKQTGDQPTRQDESDLQALYQSHMQQLTTERNRSRQALQDFHTELKQQFIKSVRSVAKAVASSKGIPTVLTSGQIFSIEDNYDITEEVIQRMQEILIESASNPNGTLR